jgi:hypothetical protein
MDSKTSMRHGSDKVKRWKEKRLHALARCSVARCKVERLLAQDQQRMSALNILTEHRATS